MECSWYWVCVESWVCSAWWCLYPETWKRNGQHEHRIQYVNVQYKSAMSLTLGNLLSSSMREMIFMGFMAIMSKASWLSVNSMCCQFMFSRLYSSCSSLKTWRTKNCCRFSLAKLIHNCSKLEERYSCMRAPVYTTQIKCIMKKLYVQYQEMSKHYIITFIY